MMKFWFLLLLFFLEYELMTFSQKFRLEELSNRSWGVIFQRKRSFWKVWQQSHFRIYLNHPDRWVYKLVRLHFVILEKHLFIRLDFFFFFKPKFWNSDGVVLREILSVNQNKIFLKIVSCGSKVVYVTDIGSASDLHGFVIRIVALVTIRRIPVQGYESVDIWYSSEIAV